MMDASSWLALLGFIAACFLAAMTGAFFRPREWYERLRKPSWRPPNRLFAPVWAILYVMIAVSGWLVWREGGFFGAVWPLIVQATYAAQQMSPQLRQVAKAFRLSPLERLRYIFAPQALPFLMTGLRVAAAISLILAVTAEYFGQTGGIGFQLFQMHEIHDPPRLFVYMFTAAVLGVLLNVLLIAIQRRVLWWHPSEREKARR